MTKEELTATDEYEELDNAIEARHRDYAQDKKLTAFTAPDGELFNLPTDQPVN